MTPKSHAAEILVVRAVEEVRPDAIPSATLVDALAAAGDLDDEPGWLWRRATYLLDQCLTPYRPLASMCEAADGGTFLFIVLPLLVGALSNYLGPHSRIHVLFNPIAFLVVWNLLMYVLLPSLTLLRRSRSRRQTRAVDIQEDAEAPVEAEAPVDGSDQGPVPPVRSNPLMRWAMRRLVPGLWLRFSKAAGEAQERAGEFAAVARKFWGYWFAATRPALALNGRRALHWMAVGLTVGAVVGMYVRGLFFEYNVIWRSTFIRDPDVVALMLRCLLGPAALLLGQSLPEAAEAAKLMTPSGAPAASWIHLYAASAAVFVVIPRTAMAIGAGIRRRVVGRKLELDLGEDYYQRLLNVGRNLHVQRVEEAIGADVKKECRKFSDAVATFVCKELYDERIVPRLEDYRTQGGAISDLEKAIESECVSFREAVERHLPIAQQQFERSLTKSIEHTIGTRLAVLTVPASQIATGVGTAAEGSSEQVIGSLGHRLADLLSGTVSAAVAVAAGTISGGLGKTLGTAILVGLLHTTGPVGFIVGALGGLLIASAGWWLGRDRLAAAVKETPLPGLLVRASLLRFGSLVDSGREKCRAAVKNVIDRELEPLTPKIAEQIWHSVKPILGDQHRQGKAPEAPEADQDSRSIC